MEELLTKRVLGTMAKRVFLMDELAADTVGLLNHLGIDSGDVLMFLSSQPQEREKVVRKQMQLLLSPAFLRAYPKEVDRLVIEVLRNSQPVDGYLGELAAARGHNTCARLAEIHLPTLVVHGTVDTLVPLESGLFLAERIPEAQFIAFKGAGHLF